MATAKIVLKQDVDKVGKTGDVITVAAGFARNYLIPRGLAIPANKGNMAQAERWRQQRTDRAGREKAAAQQVQQRLQNAQLRIPAQAGPDGRLFGSVTSANIAEALAGSLQLQIDRHAILLDAPIRHLGFHEVAVKLHPEVTGSVTVEVVALEAP